MPNLLLFIPKFSNAENPSLLPTPYSLLPTPYSLLPTPYSLLPTPYSLLPLTQIAYFLVNRQTPSQSCGTP
ncbi:MAG: hypothetical protein F6K49_32220 [Moorea sp. SIO3I6]|nr:hypothetical protein [Moorena sp. SIO3I8]NEP26460.1 hypothetical protein [Moorena sp. SIO3I6]